MPIQGHASCATKIPPDVAERKSVKDETKGQKVGRIEGRLRCDVYLTEVNRIKDRPLSRQIPTYNSMHPCLFPFFQNVIASPR